MHLLMAVSLSAVSVKILRWAHTACSSDVSCQEDWSLGLRIPIVSGGGPPDWDRLVKCRLAQMAAATGQLHSVYVKTQDSTMRQGLHDGVCGACGTM